MVDGSAGTCLFQRPGRRLGRQRDPPCLRHRDTRGQRRREPDELLSRHLLNLLLGAWHRRGKVRLRRTRSAPWPSSVLLSPELLTTPPGGQREPQIPGSDTRTLGSPGPVSRHTDLGSQGGAGAPEQPKSGNRNAPRTLPVPVPPSPAGNRSHRCGLAGATTSQGQEAPSQLPAPRTGT